MKIYVASSWRNLMQPGIVTVLRRGGHEVYDFKNPVVGSSGFRWTEIDPNWKNWTPKEFAKGLVHPVALEGFGQDFDAMRWADCCVLVLPCGRSAHLEAGWFIGQGKPVYVLMLDQQEPELMYLLAGVGSIVTSLADLQEIFKVPN